MKYASFWKYFDDLTKQLNRGATTSLVDRLHGKLLEVHEGLALEVSEPDENDCRELIISANGNSKLFSLVEALVQEAPNKVGWTFIPLRPARGFDFVYRQDRAQLAPQTWKFRPMRSATGELGIQILVPGSRCQISDAVLETIVETGIGERVFASIWHLEYTQSPGNPERDAWIDMSSLGTFIEWQRRNSG